MYVRDHMWTVLKYLIQFYFSICMIYLYVCMCWTVRVCRKLFHIHIYWNVRGTYRRTGSVIQTSFGCACFFHQYIAVNFVIANDLAINTEMNIPRQWFPHIKLNALYYLIYNIYCIIKKICLKTFSIVENLILFNYIPRETFFY